MKGYIVYQEEGEYDSYSQWVECIYLVPDNFNYKKFWDESWNKAKKIGLVRITKNGTPFSKDWKKAQQYVNKCLAEKFEKLQVVNDEESS
jgi:hypothetical protein